jgi:fructose-1,6-bisphosphatase/inositol monophosphatase family enzyme
MIDREFGGLKVAQLELAVGDLIRHASATAIMPRYCQLSDDAVLEKTPGELVTIADGESEQILSAGLAAILPAARVVGEEACCADPTLLDGIEQGLVWIVDPLDGTGNFAGGREPFGIIVALAIDGVTEMGWLYLPVPDRMFVAVRGEGAFVREADGSVERVTVGEVTTRPVATLATQFMAEELRAKLLANAEAAFELKPIPRCAADHYPRLCEGAFDLAMFQRTLPWDHAAGALLLTEAGGHIARWDGSHYRFHDVGLGILAATSRELWDQAAEILLADGRLAAEGHHILPQKLDVPAS